MLRDAVAERPVFLWDFQKIHKNVFRPDAGDFGEILHDARVERLLLIGAPRVAR